MGEFSCYITEAILHNNSNKNDAMKIIFSGEKSLTNRILSYFYHLAKLLSL